MCFDFISASHCTAPKILHYMPEPVDKGNVIVLRTLPSILCVFGRAYANIVVMIISIGAPI